MIDSVWRSAGAREAPREAVLEAIVVSQVCLLREYLSRSLIDDGRIHVLEVCASIDHALASIETLQPSMILLDAGFSDGTDVAAVMGRRHPRAQIVAIALLEIEETILKWAEAGIAGYVPASASMRDLPGLLIQIHRGEQPCPSRIAGSLLRGIARARPVARPNEISPRTRLTPREQIVVGHLRDGLSNKDIARRLAISLGTAKSHVHNIFEKLNMKSRAELAAQVNFGRLDMSGPHVDTMDERPGV